MPKQTFSEKLQTLIEKEYDIFSIKNGLENARILLNERIEKANQLLQSQIDGNLKLKEGK